MLLLSSADFFQNQLFQKKIIQEHYQSVKWFESRSGPTFRLSADEKVATSKERVWSPCDSLFPVLRVLN